MAIFFALFTLTLPLIAPILYLTDILQTRYHKARERLHLIHHEQARVERLIEQVAPDAYVMQSQDDNDYQQMR